MMCIFGLYSGTVVGFSAMFKTRFFKTLFMLTLWEFSCRSEVTTVVFLTCFFCLIFLRTENLCGPGSGPRCSTSHSALPSVEERVASAPHQPLDSKVNSLGPKMIIFFISKSHLLCCFFCLTTLFKYDQ